MRLFLLTSGLILIGTWMNIVLNNYFQIIGLKINWLLMLMLVLSFRHSKLMLSFIGIFAGLVCDAHSHGIMGLYGSTFFLTMLFVGQIKKLFFANTFLSISLAILGMSIFHGWLSLLILGFFEKDVELSSLIVTSTLPLAFSQGLLTPVILQIVIWGENLFLKDVT